MSIVASKKLLVDLLSSAIEERLEGKLKVKVVTPRMFSKYIPTDSVGELAVFHSTDSFRNKSKSNEIMNLSRGTKFIVYAMIKDSAELDPEEYVDFVIDSLAGQQVNENLEEQFITVESDKFVDETDDDYIVYEMVFNVPGRILKSA